MEGATTVMETLTKAVGDVFSLMGTCFTQITSQPVLVLFLAGSLISAHLQDCVRFANRTYSLWGTANPVPLIFLLKGF